MKTKWVYWGTVMAESADFPGCWAKARIRPRWYWWLRRGWLWARIWHKPWRKHDPENHWEMDAATAWDVTGIVYRGACVGPMRVNVAGKAGER